MIDCFLLVEGRCRSNESLWIVRFYDKMFNLIYYKNFINYKFRCIWIWCERVRSNNTIGRLY